MQLPMAVWRLRRHLEPGAGGSHRARFQFAIEYRIKRGATLKALKYERTNANVGEFADSEGPPGKNADSGIFLLNTNFATPVSVDATIQADVKSGKTKPSSPTVCLDRTWV
jgi:hypothetical protein